MNTLKNKLVALGVLIPGIIFGQGMMGMHSGSMGMMSMSKGGMGMMNMSGCQEMMESGMTEMHDMGLFNSVWMLNLTDAQQDKVTKLRENYLSQMIEKRFALDRVWDRYRDVVDRKGKQSTEAENTLKEIVKLQNDIYALRQNAYRDLKKVVGPENFEKLYNRYSMGMKGMMPYYSPEKPVE